MAVLVRHLINLNIGPISYSELPGEAPPTLSQKAWAKDHPKVHGYTYHPGTSSDGSSLRGFGPEEPADRVRLDDTMVNPVENIPEDVRSEGDVRRLFHRSISSTMRRAFANHPRLREHSETGPLGHTTASVTVDEWMAYGNHCVVIGKLKRVGILNPRDWKEDLPTSIKNRLGPELRA